MKGMIYKSEPTVEILHSGNYKGFEFKIVSLGFYPCAYIKIPEKHKFYNKHYFDIDIDCHGGLTFSAKLDDGYWIGWDYAHFGDFSGMFYSGLILSPEWCCNLGTKKYTTEEIFNEVKDVIEQLNKE